MAIDSRNKRASVIGHALPAVQALPAPDNTVADVDRKAMAWIYAAVLIAGPILSSGDHILPPFTQAATAEIEVHASGDHTLPPFTQTAAAKVAINVSGDHTLPAFTQDGTAEIEVHASGDHTLPAFTQSASASIEGFVSKIGDGDGTSGGNYQRPTRIFAPDRKPKKKAQKIPEVETPEEVLEEEPAGFEEILTALRGVKGPLSSSPELVNQILVQVEPSARESLIPSLESIQIPAEVVPPNPENWMELGNRVFLEIQKIRVALEQGVQNSETRTTETRRQLAEILETADRGRVIATLEAIQDSEIDERERMTALLLALAAA